MYIFSLLQTIFTAASIIAAIFGALFFIFRFYFKKHKPGRTKESELKAINFKRANSIDYVPIEDVREGTIVAEKFTRFITSVKCKGFDFFSAHPAEQMVANEGYVGFINTIDKPIQKRIYSRRVDLEEPIKRHKRVVEGYDRTLMTMYSEGMSLEERLKNATEEENPYLKQVSDKLFGDIKIIEWKKKHMEHVRQYMENMSGEGASPVQEETYVFDWIFNPNDFPTDVSKEEIFVRAKKELDSKANQMKSALKNAGVRVYQSTDNELIDTVRRHFQPFGSDIYKMSDVEKSNYDEMVVTSKSLEEAQKRYYETIKEEVFQTMGQEA